MPLLRRRHCVALKALKEQGTLRYSQLPHRIGISTMHELVGLGLAEIAPTPTPTKDLSWRLAKKLPDGQPSNEMTLVVDKD